MGHYCVRELNFWKENLTRLNLNSVVDCPSETSNYVVYSDASTTGCGAHLDVNSEQVCHKLWDVNDCGKVSTWKELTAISFALQWFLPPVKGSYVRWFSDGQNACKIL